MTVYVPAPGSYLALEVVAGSGLVGTQRADGTVVVDYEGNLYGASNLVNYADRVLTAAGRHADRYPTRARAYVDPADLIEDGTWDGNVVDVTNATTLAAWLGVDEYELATETRRTGWPR